MRSILKEGCTQDSIMTEHGKSKKRRDLPHPRTITLPDQDYQPPKAEREKEHDMPGASLETVRRAFFRPFSIQRESAD